MAPSRALEPAAPPAPPSFRAALRFWALLGCISFGGPGAQIALLHTEVVERRRWIDEDRFLHALNYCMLLPGPEAQQLATYCGWLLHGTRGGLAAGILFVLPSAVLLWLLSYAYMASGALPWVSAIFAGLKPAVLAVVLAAAFRIGGKTLKNPVLWSIALGSFAALYFARVPFPLLIAGAALLGWLGGRVRPDLFQLGSGHGSPTATIAPPPRTDARPWRLLGGVLLWLAPTLAAATLLGHGHAITQQGIFFAKAALVTFGGAYAVLPYVSQQAVETHGWLSAAQMLDGLALAETTPGPLIMVLQFVGFVGAWQQPGHLSPLWAATLGAAITTWSTFVPSFLFIFSGAPYLERLRSNRHLTHALSAVTAAVVGVILNLAVWFGAHVLFPRGFAEPDLFACAVGAAALFALLRLRWNLIAVIAAAGAAGALAYWIRP